MFKKDPVTPTALDEAIDSCLADLNGFTADAPEYDTISKQLKRLYKLKDLNRPPRVSPDVLATIGGNLLVVAVVVGYERANVITTKALSFVTKFR